MPSFNNVTLIGHLTREVALKFTATQTPVAEFGIATNRKFKTAAGEDREEVCFVDCTAFGKSAEVLSQYAQKGNALFVSGRLKYESWDDKNGGGKRSRLTVVVENFQFLGNKPEATTAHEAGPQDPYPRTRQSIAAARPALNMDLPDKDARLDDVPF